MEKSLRKNIFKTGKQFQHRLLTAFILLIFSNIIFVLIPLIMRHSISKIKISAFYEEIYTFSIISFLWPWILLMLLLSFIAAYAHYRMRMIYIKIVGEIECNMRSLLFERLQHQRMEFYEQYGIGELMNRLTSDLNIYRNVYEHGILFLFYSITLIVPSVLALYFISPFLATIALLPFLILPIFNLIIAKKVYHFSNISQKGLSELSNMTQEHFNGIRTAKGYNIESHLFKIFSQLCFNLIKPNAKLSCYQDLLIPFFAWLTRSIMILLILWGSIEMLGSNPSINASDFVSFIWIQSYIFNPILGLALAFPIYIRGKSAYKRLFEMHEKPLSIQNTTTDNIKIPKNPVIEFRNLEFYYPKKTTPALHNFSVLIPGGSCVGITGPIGSGKTTLLRLLNREFEVPREKLFIAGRDIHDYPLNNLLEGIATVEQIPFLFSKSMFDNVRFGKKGALVAEIEEAAQSADLHDTILSFPNRYETVIGERGITLSGGQKQRLAIARALLADRPILLLDDVFSAIDANTAARIFSRLKKEGKTIIFITHRITVLEAMDQILYMENGQLIEMGAPAELKKKNGYYSALVGLYGK